MSRVTDLIAIEYVTVGALHRPHMPEVHRTIPVAAAQGMAYRQDIFPQEHGKEVMR